MFREVMQGHDDDDHHHLEKQTKYAATVLLLCGNRETNCLRMSLQSRLKEGDTMPEAGKYLRRFFKCLGCKQFHDSHR